MSSVPQLKLNLSTKHKWHESKNEGMKKKYRRDEKKMEKQTKPGQASSANSRFTWRFRDDC